MQEYNLTTHQTFSHGKSQNAAENNKSHVYEFRENSACFTALQTSPLMLRCWLDKAGNYLNKSHIDVH